MPKVFLTKTKGIIGSLSMYAIAIFVATDTSQLPDEYRWLVVILIGIAKTWMTSRVSESNPNGTPATQPSGEPPSPSSIP
jgi:hypothetical protein